MRARWSAALTLGALAFSCLQVVDTSALDAGCPSGQKACDGHCVSQADPDFGCALDSCHPCVIANATARCSAAGTCIVATCRGEFLDCNHDGDRSMTDGCEVDSAHDPLHCGSCTAEPCAVRNGTPGCAAGRCAISLCDPGFRDCNFSAIDGCEIQVDTDPANCGKCGAECTSGASCLEGKCEN